VAGHFGLWSRGLQAAGLSARSLTFEDAVVDRIEAAWRLAARTLRRRFGSIERTWDALGPVPA
jgi:hypothetical protein